MLALAVHLVAAGHGALDGRGGKFNALALGGEVGGGNAKLYPVEPEVAVLAVGLFGAKAHGHRGAAVLTGGNQHLVSVNGGAGQILGNGNADVIHAQGQGAALELLDHGGGAIVRVQRSFRQLHRKLGGHGLCQGLGVAVGFVARSVLGDFGIVQLVQADRSHISFLHFTGEPPVAIRAPTIQVTQTCRPRRCAVQNL